MEQTGLQRIPNIQHRTPRRNETANVNREISKMTSKKTGEHPARQDQLTRQCATVQEHRK